MIKVLFVCHGNICRSPMAEYLFKEYVKDKGKEKEFIIESCATSSEEIGNEVHYETSKILKKLNIDCSKKRARKINQRDYIEFDYIIGMDSFNILNLNKYFKDDKGKIFRLLDFTQFPRDVADPYYTGDFMTTYRDIVMGIKSLYEFICQKIPKK